MSYISCDFIQDGSLIFFDASSKLESPQRIRRDKPRNDSFHKPAKFKCDPLCNPRLVKNLYYRRRLGANVLPEETVSGESADFKVPNDADELEGFKVNKFSST